MEFNVHICNDINRMIGMCDTCYQDLRLPKISKPKTLMLGDLFDNSDCEVVDATINIIFDFKCPHCGGDIALIDKGILNAITQLNRNGYLTKACCEGHVTFEIEADYGVIGAYIWFIENDDDGVTKLNYLRNKISSLQLKFWKFDPDSSNDTILRADPDMVVFPHRKEFSSDTEFKRKLFRVFNQCKKEYLEELDCLVKVLTTM